MLRLDPFTGGLVLAVGRIDLMTGNLVTPVATSSSSTASGALTKIVPAAPAVVVIGISNDTFGPAMTGSPPATTINVSSAGHSITYGFDGGSANISCGSQDPDTLIISPAGPGSVATRVADFLNGAGWGVSAVAGAGTGADYAVTVTTVATGVGATLVSGGTGGSLSAGGSDETGTRQIELVAAVGGITHLLLGASFSIPGGNAWSVADIQIGYFDGSTFSPARKIPLASLTAGSSGVADVESPNTPVLGAALVARTASTGAPADETTGSDATITATYTDE